MITATVIISVGR